MSRPRFVVTGCSRSGTQYMARLLTAVGHPCGHEAVFQIYRLRSHRRGDDLFASRPDLQGDSSDLAALFLDELPPQTVVLHQLRHPLDVIRSHMGIRSFAEPWVPSTDLAADHPEHMRFVRTHRPDIFEPANERLRCLRYWSAWNRLVEHAWEIPGLLYARYRLEAMDEALLGRIVGLIGGQAGKDVLRPALDGLSRRTNTRTRDESITWATLQDGPEKRDFEALARRYGYRLEDSS